MGLKREKGFTLLEMVTVIVLLGVISVGLGSFMKFGTQIYVDATDRDELISSARFAVERLNREIRAALPNSLIITTNATNTKQCVEFIPALASTIYQDIPVAPEPKSSVAKVVRFDRSNFSTDLFAVVYPIQPDDLYDGEPASPIAINSLPDNGTNVWDLTLRGAAIHFAQESPTERIYFVDYPISYCVSAGELTRHEKTDFNSGIPSDSGVLMANFLEVKNIDAPAQNYFPFKIGLATRVRNAILTAEFRFERGDERITLNNEIQVMNVP
ncbi:PilW family protein [Thalassotalea atypica]|uniref:PilW family protein n=1 Tax=Thalassotalea atypica TaxID=2054316 RepID=UPI002573DDBE|nr:type II secretion system protein [Thalassotalea atypica]